MIAVIATVPVKAGISENCGNLIIKQSKLLPIHQTSNFQLPTSSFQLPASNLQPKTLQSLPYTSPIDTLYIPYENQKCYKRQKTERGYKCMLLFVNSLREYRGRKQNNKPLNRQVRL